MSNGPYAIVWVRRQGVLCVADFSVNLRKLRKREGLSQDVLADQLSVSRQTISSWERGKSYPDLDMLVLMSEALHTTPNELLYPPAEKKEWATVQTACSNCFGKLALVIFIVGFLWGASEGSQAYAVSSNAVGWHFVFSCACKYWIAAFLIGMVFIGMNRIIRLLSEKKDYE